MADTPNKPRLMPDGTIGFNWPKPSPEETARRKWVSAKCGHVTRDLVRNKRLTGKTLQFALAVVGQDGEIGEKLKGGETLTTFIVLMLPFKAKWPLSIVRSPSCLIQPA